MGRGRKGILTQSEKQKNNHLKKIGTILTTFGNVPQEKIVLRFPNYIQWPYLDYVTSPEMLRVAQSLTPEQLASLIK